MAISDCEEVGVEVVTESGTGNVGVLVFFAFWGDALASADTLFSSIGILRNLVE